MSSSGLRTIHFQIINKMSKENETLRTAGHGNDFISVIHWVAVADKLPGLEKNVMIVCKDGYVGWGMRSERVIHERNKETRLYERTNKKRIEWGQEENGFEYWNEIEDVILWAEFPDPP